MFSTDGTTHTRLIGNSNSTADRNAPSTPAAPHMSYFISSIEPVGLRFMPPVSKVTPLPTSAYGLASPAPLYSSTINLGGDAEPEDTASSAPMPSFSMSAR